MLRASSREIGTTAIVPFKVPVALFGYKGAMGFGWSCVWQTFISDIACVGLGVYVELAYRSASMDKKLTKKYCNLELWACIFGRDTVRNATTGWHSRARSRQVLNIFSDCSNWSVTITADKLSKVRVWLKIVSNEETFRCEKDRESTRRVIRKVATMAYIRWC